MRNTNWKVQPYIRNCVDSDSAHSDTVGPKTKIDDFKKTWRGFHVVFLCPTFIADSPPSDMDALSCILCYSFKVIDIKTS